MKGEKSAPSSFECIDEKKGRTSSRKEADPWSVMTLQSPSHSLLALAATPKSCAGGLGGSSPQGSSSA